ncbi:hypothetical protein HF325_001151 [Metschnikowia pulcherrima]|uniref:Uncharacterized protein n=1 Tax=Metschnikowia pulcherrima TaxID=27326 RepID=A0A8H7LDC7_9ASCO|nr:hypothetical protein HF325_001151 [Metschnikowia pulcherrima]
MLAHLYNECTCSRYWWNKLGFPRPMNLREMLAPTDKTFTNLRNLNWFVKVVRKAYSGRRREAENGVSLAPLLNRLFKTRLRQASQPIICVNKEEYHTSDSRQKIDHYSFDFFLHWCTRPTIDYATQKPNQRFTTEHRSLELDAQGYHKYVLAEFGAFLSTCDQ